jgi:hypothetical protein
MTEEPSDQLAWNVPWKDVITLAVPLLTVLGFAFFGLSNYAYGHFYSSFGTTPADVGLTYFGVLAVSTGWAVALALGLSFVVPLLIAGLPVIRLGGMVGEHLRMGELIVVAPFRYGWPMLREVIRDRHLPEEEREARMDAMIAQAEAELDQEQAWRDQFLETEIEPGTKLGQLWAEGLFVRLILIIVIIVFASFLVFNPIDQINQYAEQVSAGHPGRVSAGLFGLPLVRLRADEVQVSSAGETGQFPVVDRLRGKTLIYLGRADSTVVLYDPGPRVSFYVPASTLVLEVQEAGT